MVFKDSNYFDGLSTFPRDPNELRHHAARLNYTLQRQYKIPVDVVKLALQPEDSEEFNRYYRQQVMRIIGNFNAATKKQLKVRVDSRLPKGMQLVRKETRVLSLVEKKMAKKKTELRAAASPSANNCTLFVDAAGFSGPSWGVGVREIDHETHLPQAEEQQTPKVASLTLTEFKGTYGASDDIATVSSDDRSFYDQYSMKKTSREIVFGTPPEFKGFTVPMHTSSADSIMARSPLLF